MSPDRAVLQAAERCAQSLGHDPFLARNLTQAQRVLSRVRVDLVCLDSVLPADEADRFWRAASANRRVPVVLLGPPSGKVAPAVLPAFFRRDRDGFVAKPLEREDLARELARLLAARAGGRRRPELLSVGGIVLDGATNRLLFPAGGALSLTPTEFRLLRCLMQRAGEFVPAEELLEDVWGYPKGTCGPETVRAHVSNLRRKLRGLGEDPQLVRTLAYQGYGFLAVPSRCPA